MPAVATLREVAQTKPHVRAPTRSALTPNCFNFNLGRTTSDRDPLTPFPAGAAACEGSLDTRQFWLGVPVPQSEVVGKRCRVDLAC